MTKTWHSGNSRNGLTVDNEDEKYYYHFVACLRGAFGEQLKKNI